MIQKLWQLRIKSTTTVISLLIASVCLAASFTLIVMLSPHNNHRPYLHQIQYIILHTTEGGAPGSLSKLRKNGEAHYMVDTQGQVFRLIEEDREARHAGRSLWNGRPRLDEYSMASKWSAIITNH